MDNATRITAALIGGLALGAVAALLLAPDKGDNTRSKLAKTTEELTDQLLAKAEEILGSDWDEAKLERIRRNI